MGFLSSFLGSDQARAAKAGAALQEQAVNQGIGEVRHARDQTTQALAPFRSLGQNALHNARDMLLNQSRFINSPGEQAAFIQNNPFFDALAGRATQTLFNNQAARGKVGSGGTAEALQNSLLLLGNDLVGTQLARQSQNIGQLQQVGDVGFNAALGSGAAVQNAGQTISDLLTQRGNAQAAGVVGAANARGAGASNLVNTGLGIGKLFLSDARYKQDAVHIGELCGIPVYRFRYVGSDVAHVGFMAQDVMHTYPDAVVEIGGVYYVDYGMIH